MKFFMNFITARYTSRIRGKRFCLKLSALFLSALFFFSACSANGGEQRHFTAFKNTDVTVQSRNKTLSDEAVENIRALLADLNAEFSATENASTTYGINASTAGEETAISAEFKSVAEACRDMYNLTHGKFDPSVYPLTLLWQFSPNYPVPDFSVPAESEITATKAVVGFDKFSFTDTAVKTADGAKLDFGGALKGYAADKIAEIMKADGVQKGYVNVGGSSLNLISVDNLSVLHPRKDNEYIITVKIKSQDLSVSTSGDYEKTYVKDGKTYSHLIDPETGCPADSGVISATVIGKNGLKLDALTTALCVFSHDFTVPENGELYKFIKELLETEEFKNAQFFVACASGDKKQILTNKKQGEDFTLLDKEYAIISVI